MVTDATGKPMLAWDSNQRQTATGPVNESRLYFTSYDNLHRPTAQWLAVNGGAPQMVERLEYRDAQDNDPAALQNNLQGQLVRHHDPSGMIENIRRDFKGNMEEVHRTLNNQPQASVIDWQGANPGAQLNAETFVQITEHDALNRMTRLFNWHQGVGSRVAVYEPSYNQRGALLSEKLTVRAKKSATSFDPQPDTKVTTAIQEIRYDEKGQKQYLALGNGTLTQYEYDPQTFRLKQIQTTRPADATGFPGRRSILNQAAIVQQLLYTYDPVGNITEIEDQAYEPVIFKNQIVESHSRYVYDALYRLISGTGRENGALTGIPGNVEASPVSAQFPVTGPSALRNYTQTFTYDSVGNILEIHHEAGVGTYTRTMRPKTDSNRLDQSWDGSTVTTPVNYRYDTHGNMLNFLNVTPDLYLRWDHRDMIGSIDLGGGGNVFYQYDASKQRTRKRVEHGIVEERIYLGGYERYRRTNAGAVVEEVESHHLFEGAQRVLLVDDVLSTDSVRLSTGPLFRYQYSNHLGSAGLELRDDAAIISYEEFHPYGTSAYRAMNASVEAPPKRYRYTGMERDEESGLTYQAARYCAAFLGLWISCDPLDPGAAQSTYATFRDSPIGHIDKDGQQAVSAVESGLRVAGKVLNAVPDTSGSTPAATNSPPKADQKEFWQRGYLSDKLEDVWTGLKSFAGAMKSQWQARNLSAEKVFGQAAGPWGEPAVSKSGQPLSFDEWYQLQRSTSTKATALILGFGPNTSSWMAGQPYSLRGIEGETGQNAFAISTNLFGALSRLGAGFSELKNFSAASSQFDEAMKAYSAAEAKFNTVLNSATVAERPGVQLAIERMAWKNWRLSSIDLRYGPSNGIDLVGEGVGENLGLHATVEAKPPTATASDLSRVKTLESIYGAPFRQAGKGYVGASLQTYIESGGANSAQASYLLGQLSSGNVKTLASLKGGLFEIDFWGRVAGPH
jgi:RHS repeat-associated protein